MTNRNKLRYGPLGPNCAHICADMQRLFAEDTEWKRPYMHQVLPVVHWLVSARPERTVFTRFIPPHKPSERPGAWQRYYEYGSGVTMEKIEPELVDLHPQLAAFVPPAAVIDKKVYSPWHWPALDIRLKERSVDTIVVSGIRVLSTVLGAVDRGYRVVVATDGMCSTSGQAHDAMLTLYNGRFSEQIEAVTSDVIIANWR
jgi:nicotinamidase-related amidase